jgi:hypothetical protein
MRNEAYEMAINGDSLLFDIGVEYGLDIITGPWLCGGLVRRSFTCAPTDGTDIDIAFPSGATIPKRFSPYAVGPSMKAKDSYCDMEVSMFTVEKKLGYVNNVYQLLDPFTLTCCQFATDGRVIVYSKQGLEDAKKKIARLTPGQPYNAVKLIEKYRDVHGFTLTRDTKEYLKGAKLKQSDGEDFPSA